VRDRIVAETRGNPLALLELQQGLSTPGFGGFASDDAGALPSRIETSYRARLRELPEDTRTLLLVGAAEPIGDPGLLWRAAAELGIGAEAAAPAEAAGLIRIAGRVVFRHPLLRSAVYSAATPAERRAAHRALAAATDPAVDPDRRAWHRAQAALEPDEDVASELERSAERAEGRGGFCAAAAFLERAAEVTPDASRRAARALAAARANRIAGLPGAASSLLAAAEQWPLDDREAAMLQRLRGEIALDLRRAAQAAPQLMDAARRLEPLDAALARETHLEALWAATLAGELGDARRVAEAARAAPPAAEPPRCIDLFVDGLALRLTHGYAAAAPILKQGLAAFRADVAPAREGLLLPWVASRVASDLFDDDAWSVVATRHVQSIRDCSAFGVLPMVLNFLAALRLHQGELAAAETLLDEADRLRAATGSGPIVIARLLLNGCRGDRAATTTLGEEADRVSRAHGEGLVLRFADQARALLHNGLGEYELALTAATRASVDDELSVAPWSLVEVVEAAVHSGRPGEAEAAAARLSERARAASTSVASGLEARSLALLSTGARAEELYRSAIDSLEGTHMQFHLARARLVYGEWLRRESRRVDSREQLRDAYDMFGASGANAFAERARRELHATGETPRKRRDDTRDDLTAQEEQIARLAGEGYTNPEIGAQLFLSARTVEWHLRKVFMKLGIHSRRELRIRFPAAALH
jgi:DNA-binding CsgD family transcriptional regulator